MQKSLIKGYVLCASISLASCLQGVGIGVPPVLTEVEPIASPSTLQTPSYRFATTFGGTITYGGPCSSPTTTAHVDINEITFNTLPAGYHSTCTIKVTTSSGVSSAPLNVTPFQITNANLSVTQGTTGIPAVTTDSTPDYSIKISQSGAMSLSYAGGCSSPKTSVTAVANVDIPLTFNTLADGTYSRCSINVTSGTYGTAGLLVPSFTVSANKVVVSAVAPAVLAAGFEGRVSGYHFTNLTSLLINGAPVTPTLVNDHEIRFTAPALAAGSYTLQVNTSTHGSYSTPVTFKDSLVADAEIGVGNSFACARKTTDKTVWCWGYGGNGQLGNGSSAASWTPVQVSGITTAESLTVGANHACVRLTDNTAKCWGYNNVGQLGDNTTTSWSSPVLVKAIGGTGTLANVASISAGYQHTCAALTGGGVNCWGYNGYGGLGDGTSVQKNAPVAVLGVGGTGTLASVTAVSSGYFHTCALISGGGMNCWGRNNYGMLGNASTTDVFYPVVVTAIGGTGSLANVTAITAGTYHTCALISGGTVDCWGYNSNGQVGDASTSTRTSPVAVKGVGGTGTLSTVASIAAGQYHNCARLTDNSLRCWGRNMAGQLGDNSVTQRTSPVVVTGVGGSGSLANVGAVAAGLVSTCARFTGNTVKCWGDMIEWSSGAYTFPSINNASSISLGSSHGCAILADSTVACWGGNSFGQLGNASTTDSPGPVVVKGVGGTGTLSNVVALSVGSNHNCALLSGIASNVVCWGYNNYGQLGDNSVTQRSSPVAVSGVANALSVSAGDSHSCTVLSDNTVKCWGYNNYGQLGNGSTTNSSIPVVVTGLSTATSVSAGTNHSCAILNTSTNNLRCWGRNELGQLGNNTITSPQTTPVATVGVGGTGTLDNVADLRLGSQHTCVRLTDSTVKCWGYNTNGQVGDGTTTQKQYPVAILSDVASLAADGVQSCVKLADSTARCWGYNYYGQLGDNSVTQRTSPTLVTMLKNVASIEPGPNRTCAILNDGATLCTGLVMDKIRLSPERDQASN